MPGQALPRIMPTHTFWRANMHQEWELITRARLSPLSLPASHGGSHPVSVPGCTYSSRALTKACLGIPGGALHTPAASSPTRLGAYSQAWQAGQSRRASHAGGWQLPACASCLHLWDLL